MAWIVELLDDRVRDELEALPADMRARFRRTVELIQEYGLERVHEPHVEHLEGPLWEMYMKGRDDFPGDLPDCQPTARCGRPSLRQEDTKDAQTGN
jgi:hypothetical protein